MGSNGQRPRRQRAGIVWRMAVGAVVVGLGSGTVLWRPAVQAQTPSAGGVQPVRYASGSAMIEGYLARPQGAAKQPAVILVHDNLGANGTFQTLTRQFADAGFVTLTPHLPSRSGKPAAEPIDGRPSQSPPVGGLVATQTVQDLRAAFDFLAQDPGVDASRIAAVGVGWGGYPVWKLAEQTPTLYRMVVYYGITPRDNARVRAVDTPVLGHYAEYDYLVTARVLKTKQLLGPKYTYYIYPTVPGFVGGGTGQLLPSPLEAQVAMRWTPPQAVAAAAKEAWTRTLAFLRG